jgi:tetratricopeptide (TPR) repeat protein
MRTRGYHNAGSRSRVSPSPFDSGIAELRRAIALQPDWNSYYNLGYVLYAVNRYREAIDAFTKTAELQPTFADAFQMLGTTYHMLGDSAQAIGNYEHAARLGPNANAYANLALAYYTAKRYGQRTRSRGVGGPPRREVQEAAARGESALARAAQGHGPRRTRRRDPAARQIEERLLPPPVGRVARREGAVRALQVHDPLEWRRLEAARSRSRSVAADVTARLRIIADRRSSDGRRP